MNAAREPEAKGNPYSFAVQIALATFLFAAAVLLFYAWNFREQYIFSDSAAWGEFGDFIGGVVNPFVGLATVFLIVLNIRLQRDELRASLEELKAANANGAKQSFEQSLFAWLENYRSLLSDIKNEDGKTGRDALVEWYETRFSGESAWSNSLMAMRELPRIGAATPKQGLAYLLTDPQKIEFRAVLEIVFLQAQHEFGELVHSNRIGLDPIFRTLSRLFRWIDTSAVSSAEKWHYVSLVSAQLSWIEQVYMLYYILGSGPSWFGSLATKYSLLHDVDTHDPLILLISGELTSRPPASFTRRLPAAKMWPIKVSAFEPTMARKSLGLPAEVD